MAVVAPLCEGHHCILCGTTVELAKENLGFALNVLQDALAKLQLFLNGSKSKFISRNCCLWLDGNVFLKLHIILSIGTEPAVLCSAGGALWRQYSLAILDYGDVLYRHAAGST